MTEQAQTNTRVLRWRAESMAVRSGQAVLLGGLCWILTGQSTAAIWLGATLATGVADCLLAKRALKRPSDMAAFVAAWVAAAVSAIVFCGIGLLFLQGGSIIGLTAGVLALCAVSLNNAVMSRGSKAVSLALVSPPAAALMASPILARALGLHLTINDISLLCIGSAGYAVFIARLAGTLPREAETLQAALESQDGHA